jgi:hypothetical protein
LHELVAVHGFLGEEQEHGEAHISSGHPASTASAVADGALTAVFGVMMVSGLVAAGWWVTSHSTSPMVRYRYIVTVHHNGTTGGSIPPTVGSLAGVKE